MSRIGMILIITEQTFQDPKFIILWLDFNPSGEKAWQDGSFNGSYLRRMFAYLPKARLFAQNRFATPHLKNSLNSLRSSRNWSLLRSSRIARPKYGALLAKTKNSSGERRYDPRSTLLDLSPLLSLAIAWLSYPSWASSLLLNLLSQFFFFQ